MVASNICLLPRMASSYTYLSYSKPALLSHGRNFVAHPSAIFPHIYHTRNFSFSSTPTPTTHTKADLTSLISHFAKKLRKGAFFLDDLKTSKPMQPKMSETTATQAKTSNTTSPASWNKGLSVIEPDMERMSRDIVDLLVGNVLQPTHPMLTKIAAYYFELKVCTWQLDVVYILEWYFQGQAPAASNSLTRVPCSERT